MAQTETTASSFAALSNVIKLKAQGRVERVAGVTHTYKIESHETGGSAICIEADVSPGHGVPPHIHANEDESFYVLAGRVAIERANEKPVSLETGGFFYGPRGHVHGFRNEGPEAAKLLIFCSPGAGIENMFGALAALAPRSETGAYDPAEIAAICGRYGVSFV